MCNVAEMMGDPENRSGPFCRWILGGSLRTAVGQVKSSPGSTSSGSGIVASMENRDMNSAPEMLGSSPSKSWRLES